MLAEVFDRQLAVSAAGIRPFTCECHFAAKWEKGQHVGYIKIFKINLTFLNTEILSPDNIFVCRMPSAY